MDDFERAQKLRKEALNKGLSIERKEVNGCKSCLFHYDLNQGEIFGVGGAESAAKLVRLAQSNAKYADYGEHYALLGLVADIKDLEPESVDDNIIYWRRSYHGGRASEAISLHQFLKNNGHTF